MKVLRNGQQVEFSLNAEGDLVQDTPFLAQAGFEMEVRNYMLPLSSGPADRIIVHAAGLGLARQMVRMYQATVEEEAAAAAKRAEEDAAWAARARLAAREQVAQQVANLPSATLDALRESAHADRSNLVNLYIGADRKERIAETDLIIGVIEEEQAERAGLASSEDILSSFAEVPAHPNGWADIEAATAALKAH